MEALQSSDGIDLDLSAMNYKDLSAIVFDTLVSPEKYANKRIRTAGNFYTSEYEDRRYYSALIWDTDGCTPAGFDFIPMPEMNYPEDFPEDDEKIIVTGVLKYLEEDGMENLVFIAEEIVQIGNKDNKIVK